MRAYRYTTSTPAFKHTSFNLEHRGRTTARVSFHVRYGYANRGFWLGLRPEVEVHRHSERIERETERLRDARVEHTCWRCGKKAWGEPGWRHPEGWDYIHRLDFCAECVQGYSYHDLLHPNPLRTTA